MHGKGGWALGEKAERPGRREEKLGLRAKTE
jgi:hypothetical protein